MSSTHTERRFVHEPGEVGIKTFDFKVRAFIAAFMYQNGLSQIEVPQDGMNTLFDNGHTIEIVVSNPKGKTGYLLRIPQFEKLHPLALSVEDEVVDVESTEVKDANRITSG